MQRHEVITNNVLGHQLYLDVLNQNLGVPPRNFNKSTPGRRQLSSLLRNQLWKRIECKHGCQRGQQHKFRTALSKELHIQSWQFVLFVFQTRGHNSSDGGGAAGSHQEVLSRLFNVTVSPANYELHRISPGKPHGHCCSSQWLLCFRMRPERVYSAVVDVAHIFWNLISFYPRKKRQPKECSKPKKI